MLTFIVQLALNPSKQELKAFNIGENLIPSKTIGDYKGL